MSQSRSQQLEQQLKTQREGLEHAWEFVARWNFLRKVIEEMQQDWICCVHSRYTVGFVV